MLVSMGREGKSWELSPMWSKISHNQDQTHWIESQESLMISTSQSIAYLLVVKILTHLASQVFAESEMRAEEKQNKCISVMCRGMLPVCPALLKVFWFFLQDFCGTAICSQTEAILKHLQVHHPHIYTFFFLCTPHLWALAFSEEQGKVLLSMAKDTADKLMQHDPQAAVLHQFL